MKIKTIELADGLPSEITVVMTEREAALIARLIGPTTATERNKIQHDGGAVGNNVYAALTGGVFNRFYDSGVDGVLR